MFQKQRFGGSDAAPKKSRFASGNNETAAASAALDARLSREAEMEADRARERARKERELQRTTLRGSGGCGCGF